MIILGIFIMFVILGIYVYFKEITKDKNTIVNEAMPPKIYEYRKRKFLTISEIDFYNTLTELNNEYIVVPQVNLETIVEKVDSKYRSELFKNIDFGVFTPEFELLLIELNDKTHRQKNRIERDKKLKEILNNCDIPLLTFYTDYPNEKNYVINRIRKTIIKGQEENSNQIIVNQ